MNRTRLTLVGLAGVLLLGCGADDGSTAEAGSACGAGDLRLAFTGAAGEEGGDLFGLTEAGTVRRLTNDGGSYDPSFSPDGSRIAFSSISEDGAVSDSTGAYGLDLYVIAADGSARHRLVDGDEDMAPAWSPDGEQIAFVRRGSGDGPARIFTIDSDGGSARALIDHDGAVRDADPAWSPDGTQLAFVRTEPDGLSHLMIADADGSGTRAVLEQPEGLASPSWSPDGTMLVFTLGTGAGSGSIALLDLDDGSVETVAESGLAPVWSASGRLYGYSRAPYIADFSGRWRVAELLPDGSSGFATGRAISSVTPIGFVYRDAGIDVPRCDGPGTSPLTSAADVPEALVVADPTTGEDVSVLPREQALALLDNELSSMPAGAQPAPKLVDSGAPEAVPLELPAGRLVWVVMYHEPSFEELGIFVFNATTGEGIYSSGLRAEAWDRLVDLAP